MSFVTRVRGSRLLAPLQVGALAVGVGLGLLVAALGGGLLADALGTRAPWPALAIGVAALVLAAWLFYDLSAELYRAGPARRPDVRTHLRHCALLYAAGALAGGWVLANRGRPSLDFFALSALVPMTALVGVLADIAAARRHRRAA